MLFFKVVPQNHAGMVVRFGKCINNKNPLKPGMHLKCPFIDKVIPVSLEQNNVGLSRSPIPITTEDQALAFIKVNLTYHVTDPYYYLWGNSDSVQGMGNKVQSMLRDIIGGMTLNDALDSNEKIQAELQKRISAATNMYGLHVDQVNIESLQASPAMQKHMDQQKQSQLDKVSKKNEADGDAAKIQATNQAQNQATVNTAKAQAKATEQAADAKQYAIQKNADAKKYSVQAMQNVLTKVGDNSKLAEAYFNYKSINAYKQLAHSGNLVFASGKSTSFGQIPKMAAMQKVWHGEQNRENIKK